MSESDLEWAGYLNAPHEAKPTALGLWAKTDPLGRLRVNPQLIAGMIYPGQDATEMVIEHLLMLEESGFLTLYQSDGVEWLSLNRPLKVDSRLAVSDAPPPPSAIREHSRTFAAVEREREGARERARAAAGAERAERAGEWEAWEREQARATRPRPPMLLDAPPIGCPDHPNGTFEPCGPCGTERMRHDRYLAQRRHEDRLTEFYKRFPDADNPESEGWDSSEF